jgi:HEAT repeat protein
MILLAASSWFIYKQYSQLAAPPPAPVAAVAPPVKALPVLGPAELRKVRVSAHNADPGVRWSSLEFLYTIGDPSSLPLLEKTVAKDPDPEVRIKALKLLQNGVGGKSLPAMIRGLGDIDTEVRLASLDALEQLGDPAASRWIAETAEKDLEPDVRAKALHVLGTFQDKRREEFQRLSAHLREQYESAVARSRKAAQEGEDESDK